MRTRTNALVWMGCSFGIAWLLGAPVAVRASEAFYTPPANLAAYQPGDLIRSETATDLSTHVFHEVVGQRIMYRSVGALEPVIAVTGMAFVPPGAPPAGGWPLVVWGHGTSGVGDACAPSKWPTLYPNGWGAYGDFIYALIQQGYAVVAPDYEGLGTPGLHTYLDVGASGRATINAVIAARQLYPSVGPKFATVGHSQGASASLAAGELGAPVGQSLTYVGTVALSPVTRVADSMDYVALTSDKFSFPYFAYFAIGVKATHPAFDYANLVGPFLLSEMSRAEQECFDPWFMSFRGSPNIPAEQLLNPSWRDDPAAAQAFANLDTGFQPSQAPALLVWGEGDGFAAFNGDIVQRMCANGSTVAVITYNGIGHDGTVQHGTTDVLAWLSARFAGTAAPNVCAP